MTIRVHGRISAKGLGSVELIGEKDEIRKIAAGITAAVEDEGAKVVELEVDDVNHTHEVIVTIVDDYRTYWEAEQKKVKAAKRWIYPGCALALMIPVAIYGLLIIGLYSVIKYIASLFII
jgi:hypothetical protein